MRAAFLRSFTFGLTGVVLGIYLFRAGLSSFNIGMVVAAGLVGSALATIGVTAKADQVGRRRTLVMLSILGAIGALALAFTPAVPVLLADGLCRNVERNWDGPLGRIFS